MNAKTIHDLRERLAAAECELSISCRDPASLKGEVVNAVLLVRLCRANLELAISPPSPGFGCGGNVVEFRSKS